MAYYLWFFPAAILLRRRKVELSWWVPPGEQPGGALTTDRPFKLNLALRNHGQRGLRVVDIELFGSKPLEFPHHLEALVPAGRQVEITSMVRSRSAGYQVIHGAVLHFGDALGLFDLNAYFPNPIAIKVFPKQSALGGSPRAAKANGALHQRVGTHQLLRRGLAGDLREIRDHAHGDSFKYIAWKATARRRKLMVRDLETELVITNQIVIDMAGTTRLGTIGNTALDVAIEAATSLARAAVDEGDRVGLVSFDSRIYSEIKAAEGHHHYLRVLDKLIELQTIVDEDLTDVTDGELVSAVADYLAHQEAVDVRLERIPVLDDPSWAHIQAGPSGELYDLKATQGVIKALSRAVGRSKDKQLTPNQTWSAVKIGEQTAQVMADLRRFCRLRGIELPMVTSHERGVRAKAMAAALHRASSGRRADVIFLLSDFVGYLEDPKEVGRALARARRGRRRVVALMPFAPASYPLPKTEVGAEVAAALARDEEERFAQVQRRLASQGVQLIKLGVAGNLSGLGHSLARTSSRAA